MKKILDQKTIVFGSILLGVILQVMGRYLSAQTAFMEATERWHLYTFENYLAFLGTIILMFGIFRFAQVRKRTPFWCLLAFLSVVGVALLICIQKPKEAGKDGLTKRQLNLLIYSSVFLIVYLAVHLKNYFQVGYFFDVVKGDFFDLVFTVIELPGFLASFFFVIFMFWNIHSYPFWMSETVSIIFNCVFYSYFISSLVHYFQRLLFYRYDSP